MRLGEALAGASACALVAVSLVAARPAAGGEPASPPAPADPALPPIDEARPPPPPALEPAPVPWQHHIEISSGVAFSELPAHLDGLGQSTPVRLEPGPGFFIDLTWEVFRYLRFTGYMVEHFHALDLPSGALVTGTLASASMHGYSFGARFSPTLPLGARARIWLTAGAGFGYLGYPRLTVTSFAPQGASPVVNSSPTIPARTSTIFEIPLGLGGAIDLIPRWLSLTFEVTGAFLPSQVGPALDAGQYIDAYGHRGNVAPMPQIDASFVQTLGLSLHL